MEDWKRAAHVAAGLTMGVASLADVLMDAHPELRVRYEALLRSLVSACPAESPARQPLLDLLRHAGERMVEEPAPFSEWLH